MKSNKILETDQAIKLIANWFSLELPQFNLIESYNNGSYNGFALKYEFNNVKVLFGSQKGGIDFELFLNNKQFSLNKYDDRMLALYTASENNYLIVFNAFKKFLIDFKIVL